jgi:hypothetical protein
MIPAYTLRPQRLITTLPEVMMQVLLMILGVNMTSRCTMILDIIPIQETVVQVETFGKMPL